MDDDLIYTADVAQILGVSESTVLRMVRRRSLTPTGKGPGPRGVFIFRRTDVEHAAETVSGSR